MKKTHLWWHVGSQDGCPPNPYHPCHPKRPSRTDGLNHGEKTLGCKWYLHDSGGLWWLVIITRVARACITFTKYVSIIIIRNSNQHHKIRNKKTILCNLIMVLNVTSPKKQAWVETVFQIKKSTSQTSCVPRINHQTNQRPKTSSSSGSVDHKAFCKNSSPFPRLWCD